MATILFSGLKTDSQEMPFFEELAATFEQGKGVQTFLDVGVQAFSWGQYVATRTNSHNYFCRALCIAELCKSAYRVPGLFTQGVRQWMRGKSVVRAVPPLCTALKESEWSHATLKKVVRFAKDAFGWGASFVSWGCRMFNATANAFLLGLPKEITTVIGKVGSVTGLASSGIMTYNNVQDVVEIFSSPTPQEGRDFEAWTAARDVALLNTGAGTSLLIASIITVVRLFICMAVPAAIPLSLSTLALSLNIASLYRKEEAQQSLYGLSV